MGKWLLCALGLVILGGCGGGPDAPLPAGAVVGSRRDGGIFARALAPVGEWERARFEAVAVEIARGRAALVDFFDDSAAVVDRGNGFALSESDRLAWLCRVSVGAGGQVLAVDVATIGGQPRGGVFRPAAGAASK